MVAATVRPFPGRRATKPPDSGVEGPAPPARPRSTFQADRAAMPALRNRAPPPPSVRPTEGIEPNRRRRIARGGEPLAVRLDLHGHDQDRARARLADTLLRAQAEGVRAVLVITGKGLEGQGVLRRRVPEWLADPTLRHVVAGFAVADRRHGGDGAIYVALKRRG
jgi:DNA-nicking Smr family endonuclease